VALAFAFRLFAQYAMASVQEVGPEALPEAVSSGLEKLFGAPCGQKLLKGTYGITAYEWVEPPNPTGERKVCVFGHGLGQNYGSWQVPFLQTLAAGGYTVLGYSYYGHGWSLAGDKVMGTGGGCCSGPVPDYSEEVFMTQAKELFNHVLKPGEVIDLWVGHSTGGVLGALVAQNKVWPIRTFGFVSPAFWAEKGCIGKLEGCMWFRRLIMNTAGVKDTVLGIMLENNDKAFAKDASGRYLFPEGHKHDTKQIQNVMENNIQAPRAIGGIGAGFLRMDHFPEHRNKLKTLLNGDQAPAKMMVVWGKKDIVCPAMHAREIQAMNPTIVELSQPEVGHEALSEDPKMIASIILTAMKGV